MTKDFNTQEICAICGHRLGLHKSEDYSCPKDIGRAGEFLETKFTRIAPPTTEQTELWKELLNEAGNRLYAIDAETISEETAIAQLAEKYSITRKQEVPEAVEFAEWIAQKHYYRDVHKEWYGCERGMTVLIAKTTAELFQLFKNRS